MIDLRLHTNNLVGKELVPKRNPEASPNGHILSITRKYIVDKVYPMHVKCHSVCENGYHIVECFGIGDLVQMGVLHGKGDGDSE